ncbi:MAG: hypothetical protein ACM3WS_01085 [Bacillota bacterium]
MNISPDFELLKDAYAIIDGIPETAIALGRLQTARGEALDRGTICSPAGWLAQHPQFRELGLSLSDDGERLCYQGESAQSGGEAPIMARVFGLQEAEAEHLFDSRSTYSLGDDSGLSDKRLWLREVREFLKRHGQLDEAFEEQLETRMPFAEPVSPAEIRAL